MDGILTMLSIFIIGVICSLFPGILPRLKWIISYVYVYFHQKLSSKRFDLYDFEVLNQPEKVCFKIPEVERQLETPLEESLLHRNADDVFCYGVNGKQECLLVRVSRRCNQRSEAIVYLKLANGQTFSLPEESPQYQQPSGDANNAFTCGGLKIYYIRPMRKWRIVFSGFLRECSHEDASEQNVVYVKFSFLWRACSDVFDSLSGISVSELATALSNAKWKSLTPPLKRLHEMLDFYCQAGVLYGTVKIGEQSEEHPMWLWGERVRLLGTIADMEGAEFRHVLGYTTAGKIMHVGKISVPNVVENLHFGFLMNFNSSFFPVDKAKICQKSAQQGEAENFSNLELKFNAGQKYNVNVTWQSSVAPLQKDNGWYNIFAVNHVNIESSAHSKGSGFVFSGSVRKVHLKSSVPTCVNPMPKVPPLVVKFTDPLCQLLDLSGGKGSSLAKLMALSKKNSQFTVPKGVVVTTAAYKEFTGVDFEDTVKNLEDAAYGKTSENLQDVCERTANVTFERMLPEKIWKSIEDSLNDVFTGNINALRFAVRSSATGEDTEQLSAAGQMDTFLGVHGLKEILTAVKKCWASQFKFIAVEYKRRNGQPLNCPMAVVIQEMVPCDTAGVLFTCDPVSGNPSRINITANYGLGESVVSGLAEPDTVILQRNHRNQLYLDAYKTGVKSKKIIMNEAEGVQEEVLNESLSQSHCLSDETALKLGKIALLVEENYHSHRDIEWGLKDAEIFLFQARPVTSISGETDFEIIHEFDGPIRCENEYFTVVNVGEVMPGATSPLGIDVLQKVLGHAFQVQAQRDLHPQRLPLSKYYPFGMLPFYNHFMFSLFMMIHSFDENKLSTMNQAFMVGMFGRRLEDPELFAVGKNLRADSADRKISPFFMLRFIRNMILSWYFLGKSKKKYANYRFPVEKFHTSQDLFDEMMNRCTDQAEAFYSHMKATQGSSMWNMLMLSTLASNKGGFDTDVYRDFAFLLGTCTEVESADVPSAMQSLAVCISEELDAEEFKRMDTEEAFKWLQESSGTSSTKFKDFLSRHGHRCLKEFDVHSVTWGMDPKPLVKLLQGLVGNITQTATEEKNLTISDLISRLSFSLDFKSRLLLRFLLPQCRRAVRERESSKSMLIKGIHIWRKCSYRLAEMMVREGRIPDKDLLFFLTLEEIDELLKVSSSGLIARANHRRRLFPEMDKYIFPEIMKGIPMPIDDNEMTAPIEGDFQMEGVPVCHGVAKGYARVAMTLQEAASLQRGEILITYSTDIGWSPYFPMLGGVVTEIGGLISHGAVVAREYGLPCVVGLHGATRQFRTGDRVLLDGNRGILRRLPDDK